MMKHLIPSFIGGIVGAVVVLIAVGQTQTVPFVSEPLYAQAGRGDVSDVPNGKFKVLEVENLIITNEATLLNNEGRPEISMKDGSVLADKVILGNKIVGKQIQGHAMVANRVFATPDDLTATPMEQWRFYVELGASTDAGGEVIVRDTAGSVVIGKQVSDGSLMRMGYTPEQQPQVLSIRNADRTILPVRFEPSEQQRQLLGQTQGTPQDSIPNAAPRSATREWTAKSGHKIVGDFVSFQNGIVKISQPGGVSEVPLDQLSEECQRFVESQEK